MIDLTDSQREAVESDARVILVLAGAGSGKTRVLIHRIAHLLKHGASISDFLVLTFTRKAAAEMKSRLRALLGTGPTGRDPIAGLLIGTFHSIALRILRSDGGKLGYNPRTLTIATQEDADELLRITCLDLGYARYVTKAATRKLTWPNPHLSWETVRRFREHWYTTGRPGDFGKKPADVLMRILREYRSRLRHHNALDFGSILLECRRLLKEWPEVLQRWRDRIKHVIVDEMQDTDEVQHDLHEFFAPPATLFAVGDGEQSVYGFRGARPDLMTSKHPGARIIALRECFRSTPSIVDAANNIISWNPASSFSVRMIPVRDEKPWGIGYACESFDQLATRIRDTHDMSRFRWKDIAVLARTHGTLQIIEHALIEADVPVHRVGAAFGICQSDEFLQVHACMRLSINRRDDLAFMWVRKELGVDKSYAALRGHAATLGVSLLGALQPTNDLGHKLKDDTVDLSKMKMTEWLDHFSHTFGAMSEMIEVEDFWRDQCAEMTVQDAHYWFAFHEAQDDSADGDEVTLCTGHVAKGLEWPVVYVAEMNEGAFPTARCTTPAEFEEERRLAYVEATRAEVLLCLHHLPPGTLVDKGFGPNPAGKVSRFVYEAGHSHDDTKAW